MFYRALLLNLIFLPALLAAQQPGQAPPPSLQIATGQSNQRSLQKTPCSGTSGIMITACSAENGMNGDNDPGDGAFMSWSATGATDSLYFTQIYNGPDTFQIVQTGTSSSVYTGDNDNNYSAELVLGTGSARNSCLALGVWTFRVWEVQDANGDLLPDRDAAGNIIGCYVECQADYQPSCPINPPPALTTRIEGVSCPGASGSITVTSVDDNLLYCGGTATYEWNGPDGFSSTNEDIDGLQPGTYTVTATDPYGCQNISSHTVVRTDPVAIQCQLLQGETAPDAGDGEVKITITDGVGNFTISWTGPESGNRPNRRAGTTEINQLDPGVYVFTVVDTDNGCTAECSLEVPEVPCTIDFEVTYDISATEVSNVYIQPTGGLELFRLVYNGPNGSGLPQNFITYAGRLITDHDFEFGTYTFTLSEQSRSECDTTITITFMPPDCSTLSVTPVTQMRPTCHGDRDGILEIAVSGGLNPVISWAGPNVNGSSTPHLTNLSPGTYTYTITDDNGCTLSDSYTLLENPPLELSCAKTDVTRNGADDGTINLNYTGGIRPVTLTYTAVSPSGAPLPGNTITQLAPSFRLANLPPGAYTLTITDSRGCTANCTTTILEPAPCIIDVVCTAVDVTTAGGAGGVTLSFTTADMDRSLQVFDANTGVLVASDLAQNTNAVVTGLPAGEYRVVITSFGGCEGACTFEVEGINCSLATTNLTTSPISCYGTADGAISFEVSGAQGAVVLDWNEDAYDGQMSVTTLVPGTYTIDVRDAAGCTTTVGPVTIDSVPAISVDLVQLGSLACAGDTSVSLRAVVTDAQGAVSYQWADPDLPNSAVVDNLGAGTYSVIVTDAEGCGGTTTRASITITEPAGFDLSCTASPESTLGASDGEIALDFSGGEEPFSVFTLNSVAVTRPAGDVFTGLSAGNYVIEVLDVNGCVATCTSTINPGGCGPVMVELTVTQADCLTPTGSIQAAALDANGSVEFTWDNGATGPQLSNLGAGRYCVTMVDAQGCEALGCARVEDAPVMPSVVIGEFLPVCGVGCTSVEVVFAGTPPFAVDYVIDRAGTQVPGRWVDSNVVNSFRLCPAGLGLVDLQGARVTFSALSDAGGCSVALTERRIIPQSSEARHVIDERLCYGDSLVVEGQVFNQLRPNGEFTSAVPASSGCDSIIEIRLRFGSEAVFNLADTLCPGELVVIGSDRFTSARPSGTVVLPGQAAAGCDSIVVVDLTYTAPASAQLNQRICPGTQFEYFGETFTESRPSGQITLPIPAANGCDSIVDVNIDFYPIAMSTLTTTVCPGTPVTVGDSTFTQEVTGAIVRIPDPGTGCDSLVDVTITYSTNITLTLGGDGNVCQGAPVQLDFTYDGADPVSVTLISEGGDELYLTTSGGPAFIDAPPGSTWSILSATTSTPCPINTSGSVTVNVSDLAVNLMELPVATTDCNEQHNRALVAEITGNIGVPALQWDDGSSTLTRQGLSPGVYQLTVTDEQSCSASDTIILEAQSALLILADTLQPTCLDAQGVIILNDVLNASNPLRYRLGNGAFSQADTLPAILRANPGRTVLEVEDASGCRVRDTFLFTAPPAEMVFIDPPRAILPYGDSLLVHWSSTMLADSFHISPGPDTLLHGHSIWLTALGNQEYQFVVMGESGCIATATFDLISDATGQAYAPTAFSPNDDGLNDDFRIYPGDQVVSITEFRVHDRWGGVVYLIDETFDPRQANWGWDGKTPGGDLYPTGVYIYTATLLLRNGDEMKMSGDVLLIK